jgi:hypothetical protein
VSQRCGRLSLVRRAFVTLTLVAAVAAPAAHAATTTTAPSAPVVTAPPQQQPGGSAFGPLQGIGTGQTTTPTTTVNTKRPGDTGLGRGALWLLVLVAFGLIIGVGALIWYEGRSGREERKRRRARMRAGRTPQPHAVGADGRRGPPPPPRKRRAQAAKRKKR